MRTWVPRKGALQSGTVVRDLASQESWETLTVVTSRAHAFRTHDISEQCVYDDVEANLLHSDPELNADQ